VPFVIDASVALAWVMPDEQGYRPMEIADHLGSEPATVPYHWYAEVANGLLIAERRRRMTEADCTQYLAYLCDQDIQVDHQANAENAANLLMLARAHGLTVYDATYLDLAMRTGLPLATLDQALRKAAKKVGVSILP
jgi:predicted nucleic acid-binding protein